MVKNVTVSVGDDVAEKMKAYPEVNWSEITRKAITDYINHRTHRKL